jgi:hypothetical protein
MKKQVLVVTALLAGSLLVIGTPASQAATTKPTPKPYIGAGAAGQNNKGRSVAFKAYRACLTKQGVTLPAFGQPGTQPKPATTPNAKTQKAMAACASLKPKGGFGGGGFRAGGTEFAAFVSCMKDHKVVIPAPGAALKTRGTTKPKASSTTKPTLVPSAGGAERGRGGLLAGLNQKDPKVAAALKICGALLPTQK